MMIKFTVWNIRGLGTSEKRDEVKHLIKIKNLELLCLTETRATENKLAPYLFELAPGWKCVTNYQYVVNGRIWVIWNPGVINFIPIFISDQCIHGRAQLLQTNKEILISAIYAHNYGRERRRLWESLKTIPNSDLPWIACGDFNIIRFLGEKFGGSCPTREDMEDFNDCIDHCSLHDLNFVGETLSWSNNSRTGDFKLRKLDRALVNDGWISAFPASFVKFKSQNISDHTPLVIFLQEELPNGPKPFRFFNVWLEDLSIYETVERAWKEKVSGSPMYRITQKLKLVKEAIKIWNKNIFGRMDVKLPVVRRNLEDLQAQVKANPSNLELRKKADDLKDFFILTARQEEAILRQKARNNWLTRGDTNSQFFHAAVNARRNRNNIYRTTNDHGEISSNPADIANAFVNYFSSILNSDELSPEPSAIPEPVKKLSDAQAVWLSIPVLRDEVDMVIKQCDGDKSPGPDGFNGHFSNPSGT
ncbi:uncharacterized protein LOC143859508 [Tasmannia lanceolata]|uniref:uncharacterized protein LOC143859508 n=1 Tax=Tasmannia lanceolata TaxID=3420 RepID=UPI0040634B72